MRQLPPGSRSLPVVVFLGGGLLPSLAGAAELTWQAPAGCGEEIFVRELEHGVGEELAELSLAAIEVELEGREDGRFAATVRLVKATGETSPARVLEGNSCEEVAEMAGVAVAMAVHADAEGHAEGKSGGSPLDPLPSEPEPEGREPEQSIPTDSQVKGARTPSLRAVASGGVFVDSALLAETTLGGEMGLALGLDRFELGSKASAVLPVESRLSSDLGVALSAVSVGFDACAILVNRGVYPRICLGYRANWVTGEGTGAGLSVSREQTAVWHAIEPGVSISWPLLRALQLRIGLGVAIGLSNAQFVIDDAQVAYAFPDVTARAGLALGWRFFGQEH